MNSSFFTLLYHILKILLCLRLVYGFLSDLCLMNFLPLLLILKTEFKIMRTHLLHVLDKSLDWSLDDESTADG